MTCPDWMKRLQFVTGISFNCNSKSVVSVHALAAPPCQPARMQAVCGAAHKAGAVSAAYYLPHGVQRRCIPSH